MAIPFKLYKITDGVNVCNKSLPITYYQGSGSFRIPFDINTPRITMDATQVGTSITPVAYMASVDEFITHGFNYAMLTINGKDRYYFIDNFVALNEKLVDVYLRFDPLTSYWDSYKSKSFFIERASVGYERNLEDSAMAFLTKKETTIQAIATSSGCVNFRIPTLNMSTYFIYVTCLVREANVTGATNSLASYLAQNYPDTFTDLAEAIDYLQDSTQIYAPSAVTFGADFVTGLHDFYPDMTIPGYTRVTYILNLDRFAKLLSFTMNDQSYNTYILGAIALPITNATDACDVDTTINVPLFINDTQVLLNGCLFVKSGTMSKYIVHRKWTSPTNQTNDEFYRFEPYSTYEFFLPFYGYAPIPAHDYWEKEGLIYYSVDLVTGEGQAYIKVKGEASAVVSVKCQLGTPLSLNATNYRELTNAKRENAISTSFAMISSLATIGIGVATANPIPVAMGTIGASSALAKGINSNASLIQKASVNYTSADVCYYDSNEAHVRITRLIPTGVTAHTRNFGRPKRDTSALNLLSSTYIVCGGDVRGALGSIGTRRDTDEIVRILETGAYIK